MTRAKLGGLLLRLAVSLGLLAALFAVVDISEIGRLVVEADAFWSVTALVVIVILRLITTLRWHYILRAHHIMAPFGDVFRITFVSTSIAQVLPGGIGGDVVRGYQLSRQFGRVKEVARTIVIDRVVGAYSMLFLALAGELYAQVSGRQSIGLALVLAANILFLVGTAVFCILRDRIAVMRFGSGFLGRSLGFVSRTVQALTDFRAVRSMLPLLFGFSLAVQLARCLLFWSVYQALGGAVDPVYYFIVVPAIFIANLVPISIGGLGIREGILVYFFAGLGVAPEISIGAGLLVHFLQVVVGAPALLLLLASGRRKKTALDD